MVTREQLKDWLDVNARKKYAEKLEKIFDDAIKRNALKGITTFVVSTGRLNNVMRRHEKTEFYSIWHTQDLSDDNREVVKREILKKYREHGFTVDVRSEEHTSELQSR